jgi:hypothetical protein
MMASRSSKSAHVMSLLCRREEKSRTERLIVAEAKVERAGAEISFHYMQIIWWRRRR